ncbi:type 1 fimbrial protein [Providencia sp. PROV188]|uniref:fimbrial protein n=1 Tax=unclassified Providencia TaxID=2633465 RepID=UPI0012B5201E|nr:MULTISPECIES: fimbrial protein [unclassified Providencia]MTB44040.1 type 1 fimbrial protein [Providencia sp. wls1950]MTC23246.1 type 1 fimbrial protein [Providencia sp. wls1938]MTC47295.1 type 1 fimbrial protein [Providencia sp. wls1922]MTC78299.1 type 1 fimbrial protein [Providencia sp. wls1916]WBM60993.1 type 1 fimbrial protein [Providencia sp. PROV188]
MKKSLLVLLVTSSISASVMAENGVITFNGEITATTCDISSSEGSKDFTVTLPKVSTTALANAGDIAGVTQFDLLLSNCTSNVAVAANFENTTNTDTSNGNLNPTQGPAGVQIRLADAAGTQAVVNGGVAGQTTIVSGSATLPFQAYYFAKTPVTNAGVVVAQVNYSITYP